MANTSHKRDTNARPKPRATTVAGGLALAATTAAVVFGTVSADPGNAPGPISATAGEPTTSSADVTAAGQGGEVNRRNDLSRGITGERARFEVQNLSRVERMMRPKPTLAAIKSATVKRWTTENLNLWTEPGEKATKVGLLDAGERVLLTGRELYGRSEIVWGKKKTRWVTTGYFTDEKPFALGGDCTNGTTVPSGVSENIKKVHAAVCAAFPEITTYGTFRSDGEHAQGIAVDIMVSGDRGFQVRDFILKYYQELGVHYIIYSQHIWMTERPSWVPMEDRGSPTANHYDHVHVTVYP